MSRKKTTSGGSRHSQTTSDSDFHDMMKAIDRAIQKNMGTSPYNVSNTVKNSWLGMLKIYLEFQHKEHLRNHTASGEAFNLARHVEQWLDVHLTGIPEAAQGKQDILSMLRSSQERYSRLSAFFRPGNSGTESVSKEDPAQDNKPNSKR